MPAPSRFPLPASPTDRFRRPLGSLRLSVTDRCNMRCGYCMPEESYVWLPRASLLSFEELTRLAGVFIGLGAAKLRLTGGEPLLRHDLPSLVGMLVARPGLGELALTTNGILLADHAGELARAGLGRVTISLDTLRADRMLAFARSPRHADVLRGIDAALSRFGGTKLNSVIIRGFNEDEVGPLLDFARERGIELRYIEYMDVGGATRWRPDDVVTREQLLATIARRFGPVEPLPDPAHPAAPAERFRLADGTRFGIIASVTRPFCADCDRSRVTADGTWFTCLYAADGVDLREPLRSGVTDGELAARIASRWAARADRGAEQRLATPDRSALYQLAGLRADPRREMHTRGG